MIDLKQLRENPDRFREGCRKKGVKLDFDRLLSLETSRRELMSRQEGLRAEQGKLDKDLGPQIGKLTGELKKADPARKEALQAQLDELKAKPAALKQQIQELQVQRDAVDKDFMPLLLQVPLPPDPDVPVGTSSEDNVEIKR